MTDTLKLEGVGLDVRDGSSLRTLLEIDEFCLEPGEMIAVRGASGAGKTTFLKLVSGILLPTRGRVLYGDTEVSALSEPRRDRWRGRHVGFLFQPKISDFGAVDDEGKRSISLWQSDRRHGITSHAVLPHHRTYGSVYGGS